MSRIDELIIELCPDGVEYKYLGGINGICEVLPSGVDKVLDETERPVKLCNYMDVYNNQYITNNLISGFMDGSVNGSEYQKFVLRAGQILLTKDSETMEDIAQSAYVCNDFADVVCGYHLAVLTPKININGKYLNYVLQSRCLRNYFSRISNGVSRFGLKLKSIEKALIPIPPLPIQHEIVRILDKFTSLEAELEAELEARKRQYEYYRNELFNFSEDVMRKTLGGSNGIADIGTGSNNTIDAIENGLYPFYVRSADILKRNTFEFDEEAIITSGDGVGVGKILHYVNGKFGLHQRAYRIHIKNDNIMTKYVYYFMKDNFEKYILENAVNSSVTSVRRPMLENYPIPVPPLADQERIVTILDHFDALVNDITQGLPAEITARRKQYEYYRDKLLTFKEKV